MQVCNVMSKTSKPWQKRLRRGWSFSSCEVMRSLNHCCVCSLIRMRGFVFDACIYLAVFTDNICASSVINLAHTATQEQSEPSTAATRICLATQQSLHCSTQVCGRNALHFPAIFLLLCNHFIADGASISSGFLQGDLLHIWAEEQRAFHDTPD